MIKLSIFEQAEGEPTVKITDEKGEELNVDVLKTEKSIRGYVIELEGLQLKRGRKKKQESEEDLNHRSPKSEE